MISTFVNIAAQSSASSCFDCFDSFFSDRHVIAYERIYPIYNTHIAYEHI